MRDPFGPVPTARQEIDRRIEVISARVTGFDVDGITEAKMALAAAEDLLKSDKDYLAQWVRVCEQIKQQEFPHESGDVTVLGPEIFAAKDDSVICWRGQNYIPQS